MAVRRVLPIIARTGSLRPDPFGIHMWYPLIYISASNIFLRCVKTHQEDLTMYVRKKSEMAVSPVIAVILMVAITVVLAGVLFVWLNSLITTKPPVEPMVFTASDAASTANYKASGDPTAFESGEPILKLKQTAGDQIDWQKYSLKMGIIGQDDQYDVEVYSINGGPFYPGNMSMVGDIILIHCPDSPPIFHANNIVTLSISSSSGMSWDTGEKGILVK